MCEAMRKKKKNKVEPTYNSREKTQLKSALLNGGCCGSVSDAWLPSYESK